MKPNEWVWLVSFSLLLSLPAQIPAQPTDADRQRFEETKIKAQRGEGKAQLNLGVMYYEGEGVDRDYVQAYKWFSLAAGQGTEAAKKNMGLLEARLTGEQIAEAQRLAREFIARRTPAATASRSAADKGGGSVAHQDEVLGTNMAVGALSGDRESARSIPLHDAVQRGMVKVKTLKVRGLTGDVIRLELQRTVPEVLAIQLAPGTVFSNVAGTVQNMAGAVVKGKTENPDADTYLEEPDIVLTDNRPHWYVVEGYCLDFHSDNPSDKDAFVVGVPDARTARILAGAGTLRTNIQIVQAAIWLDRQAGLSDQDIKQRFPVSNADIASARAILKRVPSNDLKPPSKAREEAGAAQGGPDRLASPQPQAHPRD